MPTVARIGLVLSLLAPVTVAGGGRAAPPSDFASAAAARGREILSLVNRGDIGGARRYSRTSVLQQPPMMPGMASFDLGAFAYDLHARSGRLVLEALEPTPTGVEVRARSTRLGIVERLVVEVEREAPHRVVDVSLSRPQPLNPRLTEAVLATHLDRYLSGLAQRRVFSGVVLLARDERIVLHKAYGPGGSVGVTPTLATRFNLASMAKMFTAVAVAQLVEAGKISFDDPIDKWLPGVLQAPGASGIRVSHLLSHTSGLGDYLASKVPVPVTYVRVTELLPLLAGESLSFTPGTDYAYSNSGFLLLGALVERITRLSYFEYVATNILRPAGMRETSLEPEPTLAPVARGFEKRYTDAGVVLDQVSGKVGRGSSAGGGYSTATDLLAFARALQGHRLLSAEMTTRLMTPKPKAPRYGFGFFIEDDARRLVGHGGGALGAANGLDLFLRERCTAVVLSNVGAHGPGAFADLFAYMRSAVGQLD